MFWKVSGRSEPLYYDSSHTTSLPVVRHDYRGFNIVVGEEALDKGTCLQVPACSVHTAGLEMKNKTIRGQTEGRAETRPRN